MMQIYAKKNKIKNIIIKIIHQKYFYSKFHQIIQKSILIDK